MVILKLIMIVLVITGGNIDPNLVSRIIDRGLVRTGRRLRLNVIVKDQPGSLARLTNIIAQEGANILQTIHDRNAPSTLIDETDIQFTLETKGEDHAKKVTDQLRKIATRVEIAQ